MPASIDEHGTPSRIKAALGSVVWRITPACHEVTRLMSQEHDRRLPLGTRLRLSLHRHFCVWCDRYARQLGLAHEAMGEASDHLETPALPADRKARLKRALQGEAASRRLR